MIELDPCYTRTVKPRKTKKKCDLPIVVVDPATETVLSEVTGQVIPLDTYVRELDRFPKHIVITFGTETLLWKLNEHWKDNPWWSWRVAVTNRSGRKLQTRRVAYYGFKDPARKNNRYSIVMDASSFFRRHDAQSGDLLKLGQNVREFCNTYGLEVRASAAGIASQLLKHPMFYPFARRRVPGFINEEVRPFLPGGYYDAYRGVGQRVDAATYIDQESAHHYAAQTTPLPNANSVRAIGYSRQDRCYARRDGELFTRELSRHHGLLKAKVRIPQLTEDVLRFAPPLMHKQGERVVHIWTNELEYLESLGLEVLYIMALWGTDEVDNGLAKYATWARSVGKQYPELKALLLMPYGLLARHSGKSTYHHPHGADPLILAGRLLEHTHGRVVHTQPETANALQLGLIQSFVRCLSLDMARQATANGHEIISIYADGIFIKLATGKQLPLYAPWRVKEEYLELELTESLSVPVRRKIRRDYIATKELGKELV